MMRRGHSGDSGWSRSQPERYVGGRRPQSPAEHERQRLAHEEASAAHQANSGGLDWLTTLQKKDPTKAKQLLQTRPSATPLRSVKG
jgi:hypothetical protein